VSKEKIKDFEGKIKALGASIKEKIVARLAAHGADKTRYSPLKIQWSNDYLKGINSYHHKVSDLLLVLNNNKHEYPSAVGGAPSSSNGNSTGGSNGNSTGGRTSSSFLQANEVQARANEAQARGWFLKGINGSFKPHIT